MSDLTQFTWGGEIIMLLTVVTIFTAMALIVVVVELINRMRHDLRSRYFGSGRELNLVNLLLFPVWLLFEILCLVLQLAFGLISALLIYQGAKEARDWWHAGKNGHR